ncbi:MAG: cardiolipin synthase [Clostridia bacterium]|nr:cardiolipin synthase [Clostridia bacterium]
MILRLGNFIRYANLILQIFSLLMVFYIAQRDTKASFKLAWVVPILLFPLFGGLIYLFFGTRSPTRGMKKKLECSQAALKEHIPDSSATIEEIATENASAGGQMRYLQNTGGFPVYQNTEARYFPLGEELFDVMLEELNKAERFIFLEFFIIAEGRMWNSVLEILEEKVKQGVEVRVIYDDVGSLTTLPYDYNRQLEKKGIRCISFNPFKPVLSIVMNNRDHRKIMVVDGKAGFTGGVNLADEYINEKLRYGHWKDTAVMLRGEAVRSLTLLFLEMWNAFRPGDSEIDRFLPDPPVLPSSASDGFVQPYGDSPLDGEPLAENVYLNIIHGAKRYVYICTPYLIIDEELEGALTLAAKRGVDVRLITPAIPDKKSAHALTRSHYPKLLSGGVKIYEYTPGFIHAKSFVCDDEIATVGTVNLDYRSLYLHFECGVYFYRSSLVADVKRDFLETQEKCAPAKAQRHRFGMIRGLYHAILRLFAPLF